MDEVNSSQRFYQRLSQRVIQVCLIFLFPGLVASAVRAYTEDGAYGVVALQTVTVAGMVILALPWERIGPWARLLSAGGLTALVAVGAVVRNADIGAAMAFVLTASVFVCIGTASRWSYLFMVLLVSAIGALSQFLWDHSWAYVASNALVFGGLAWVLALLVRSVFGYLRGQVEGEARLLSERDNALAQLKLEEQRRTAVSENANVAFFQFDYASGRCYGDATELARHGLSPDAEFWDVAKDVHLYTPESQELIQSQIAEVSQKPVGATAQFVLQFRVQPSDELRSFRISGLNVEVDGKVQFAGASIDITEEMNALEKAKELSSKIELVSGVGGVGLIEFFPDTHTFKCNPEVSARLGHEHSESERDIALFYAHQTEETVAEFKASREALYDSVIGEMQSFVHPFYFANGELHYMRVSSVKREVNGRTSFLGLSLDITDEAQAKEKAEKQAEQLNLLAVSGEVAYFEVDLELGRVDGNALLKQRAGLPADAGAFSMEQIVDSIPVDAREEFQTNVQRVIEAGVGAVTVFEHPYYKHDGELIYVRVTATTFMRHGRLHALGASVEITESVVARKQAEQQAEQLRKANDEIRFRTEYLENMLEAAPIPVCLLEGDSKSRNFTYVNKEMVRVLGYTEEEMLGQNATEMMFLNDEDRQYYMSKVVESMKGGIPLREEMQFYRKNKVIGNFEMNCRYEMVGEKLFGTLFFLDIDERKQREQQLERAVQASDLAASKLEQERDRQAQMYAVIGHELRTPAASLQMMLDDLGEGEDLDSALARANIEQLLFVIDTLRAVAQPERMAQAAYNNVQLDEMLQQQVQNFQTLAARHGIQLQTDFTGLTFHPVHIQKTLLRQVLSNLIKNALIHSGGTELEVGASGRLLEGERKALRLWIADNGKGVSADKVERLFEAFVRGSTEAEGTGLGLHICREIIQNVGGDLRYEPRPEGGACFVIELEVDLAKTDLEQPLKPQTDESPLKGMRILVAEDNKTIQMLTEKMLEKQGAQVTVGNNGKEALEAFEPGKFDLVLSDIFMPEMNGYEFAREVRLVDTAVPLIGLTAATIGKETDEMLAAGASTVLSKPISLSKLLDKLAEIELSQNPA